MKYIATILILFVCFSGCKQEEKTVRFTLDDIMTVFQNGYLKGEMQGLSHNGLNNWERDSLEIVNTFKPLYK